MRRLVLAFVALLLSAAPASAQMSADRPASLINNLSVKLAAGLAMWRMPDWGMYYDSYEKYARSPGTVGAFSGNDLKWAPDLDVEVLYHFSRSLRIGLGLQRVWGRGQFSWDENYAGEDPVKRRKTDDSLEGVITPVCLTLYYLSPETSGIHPYIGIGAGYYFSSYLRQWGYDTSVLLGETQANRWIDVESDLSSGTFGYHAVFGAEYYLGRGIGLAAELRGQYVRILNYGGDVTLKLNNDEPVTLGSDQVALTGTPNHDRHHSFDGIMDFSGFSLKLGTIYHF